MAFEDVLSCGVGSRTPVHVPFLQMKLPRLFLEIMFASTARTNNLHARLRPASACRERLPALTNKNPWLPPAVILPWTYDVLETSDRGSRNRFSVVALSLAQKKLKCVGRGYSEKKVGENVECEIMQVVLEEAKEGYPEEAVHEVPSNTIEELESNVSRVAQWLDAWRSNNAD